MKEYAIDGKVRTLYTVGEFATAVGKKAVTIRKWERDGIIPKASFRDDSNRRLYSESQIREMRELVSKYITQGKKVPQEFIMKARDVFKESV